MSTAMREPASAGLPEAFQAQTLPHLDALYADAFCLTGSREDAADLVVAAYARAFQDDAMSRQRRNPAHLRARDTLTWLRRNLHAVLCDRVLARTTRHETTPGEQP